MRQARRLLFPLAAMMLAAALITGCATPPSPRQVMLSSDWVFHDIVDVLFVRQYAKVPQPEGVMIIDVRPYRPKYVNGHIPTAMNIPYTQFDNLKDRLPRDKNTLLIFYCGGYHCKLSHKSARKAEILGYRNVKVFAAGYPAWVETPGTYSAVTAEYVARELERNEMMLVDARPKKLKYDRGYIPSAISIPDSQFEKLKGKLPADKNTLLVFYCGGLICKLSHKSAQRAIKLGYTNVKVFAAGYPGWKKYAGHSNMAVAREIKKGDTEGSIDIATFTGLIEKDPGSIMLIDVRDADEYARGHFNGAVNIPVDDLEKELKSLPTEKPIVFVCSTGARSGESYYMVQDLRPELKKVYYLEAEVTYKKDGTYKIKKNR